MYFLFGHGGFDFQPVVHLKVSVRYFHHVLEKNQQPLRNSVVHAWFHYPPWNQNLWHFPRWKSRSSISSARRRPPVQNGRLAEALKDMWLLWFKRQIGAIGWAMGKWIFTILIGWSAENYSCQICHFACIATNAGLKSYDSFSEGSKKDHAY